MLWLVSLLFVFVCEILIELIQLILLVPLLLTMFGRNISVTFNLCICVISAIRASVSESV